MPPPSEPAKKAPTVEFEWSQQGQALQASSLAALVNAFRGVEGVITLSAGLPSSTSFPLTCLSATTTNLLAPPRISAPLIGQQVLSSAPHITGGRLSPEQPPFYGLASQRPSPWWQFSSSGFQHLPASGLIASTKPSASSPAAHDPLDPNGSTQDTAHDAHNQVPDSNGSHSADGYQGTQPGSLALHPPAPLHTTSLPSSSINGTGHAAEGHAAQGSSAQGQAHEGQRALGYGSNINEALPSLGQQQQFHISGQLISDAQQYMFHSGHPPLLQWTRHIVDMCHAPPCTTQCVITSGAVHALNCAVACLCDRGDFIVCEEFAYTHAPECVFTPNGLHMLPVTMDEQGMVPDALRHVIKEAGVSSVTGQPPRVIYIIPSGQNPTGAVMGIERKREIYEICRSHNLVILEDDAYYWLQYPGGAQHESQQPGLCLPPSLLSMDVDGRVLRIDTFAKLLGPGYRLGWITAPPALAAKMASAVQASSCGPSSLSQVVVSELINKWGIDGFEVFVRKQQASYARRAAAASFAAHEHLKGLVTFREPSAGMFMWFKLHGLPDFGPKVVDELVKAKVVVVPGRPFWTNAAATATGAPCPYFRATFGSVSEDQLQEGFARLAIALKSAMAQTLPCN